MYGICRLVGFLCCINFFIVKSSSISDQETVSFNIGYSNVIVQQLDKQIARMQIELQLNRLIIRMQSMLHAFQQHNVLPRRKDLEYNEQMIKEAVQLVDEDSAITVLYSDFKDVHKDIVNLLDTLWSFKDHTRLTSKDIEKNAELFSQFETLLQQNITILTSLQEKLSDQIGHYGRRIEQESADIEHKKVEQQVRLPRLYSVNKDQLEDQKLLIEKFLKSLQKNESEMSERLTQTLADQLLSASDKKDQESLINVVLGNLKRVISGMQQELEQLTEVLNKKKEQEEQEKHFDQRQTLQNQVEQGVHDVADEEKNDRKKIQELINAAQLHIHQDVQRKQDEVALGGMQSLEQEQRQLVQEEEKKSKQTVLQALDELLHQHATSQSTTVLPEVVKSDVDALSPQSTESEIRIDEAPESSATDEHQLQNQDISTEENLQQSDVVVASKEVKVDQSMVEILQVHEKLEKIDVQLAGKLMFIFDEFDSYDLLHALWEMTQEGSDIALELYNELKNNTQAIAYAMGYVQSCMVVFQKKQVIEMLDLLDSIKLNRKVVRS